MEVAFSSRMIYWVREFTAHPRNVLVNDGTGILDHHYIEHIYIQPILDFFLIVFWFFFLLITSQCGLIYLNRCGLAQKGSKLSWLIFKNELNWANGGGSAPSWQFSTTSSLHLLFFYSPSYYPLSIARWFIDISPANFS